MAKMKGLPLEGREPYLSAAATLLRESGCTILRWRSNLTGYAAIEDDDWSIVTPRPSTASSFGVFAHEVGHHMLHRERRSSSRWLEEIEAWQFAVDQFTRFELPGYDELVKRANNGVRYALRKALRRSKAPGRLAVRMRAALPPWVPAESLDEALVGVAERRCYKRAAWPNDHADTWRHSAWAWITESGSVYNGDEPPRGYPRFPVRTVEKVECD